MKTVLRILSALFIAASPFVLYWTLTRHDVAVAALILIAWVLVRTIPIFLSAKKEQRLAAIQLPAIALGFASAQVTRPAYSRCVVRGLPPSQSLRTKPLPPPIAVFTESARVEIAAFVLSVA